PLPHRRTEAVLAIRTPGRQAQPRLTRSRATPTCQRCPNPSGPTCLPLSETSPSRHASTVLARPCDIPSQTAPSRVETPCRRVFPGRQDEPPRAHAKPTCRPRVAYVPIPSDIPIRLLSGRLAESPHATPTCLPNAARRRTARQPPPAREAPPSTPGPCDRP